MQKVSSVQGMLNLRCQWDNPVIKHIWQLNKGLIQKYGFKRTEVASLEATREGKIAWERRGNERKIEGLPQFRSEWVTSQRRLSRGNYRGRREK